MEMWGGGSTDISHDKGEGNQMSSGKKVEIKILSENSSGNKGVRILSQNTDISSNSFVRKLAGLKTLKEEEMINKKKSPSVLVGDASTLQKNKTVKPNVLQKNIGISTSFPSIIDETYFQEFNILSSEDKMFVQGVLMKLNLLETAQMMKFASETHSNVSEISDMLLQVGKGISIDINEPLNDICNAVSSVGEDEILQTGGMFKRFKTFVAGCGPHDRMKIALDEVDIATSKVSSQLPDLIKHIEILDGVLHASLNCNHKIDLYLISGQIAIKYYKEKIRKDMLENIQRNPSEETYLQNMDFSIEILEKKLSSLRELKISAEQDPVQIKMMKMTYHNVVETAENTILSLVSQWKRSCSVAMTLLDAEEKERIGGQSVGSVAGEMFVIRDKIVNAIGGVRK